jgi:predicted N-acetyltransferase YhbS
MPADVPAVAALMEGAFGGWADGCKATLLAHWLRHAAELRLVYLVAELNGEIVGYAGVGFADGPNELYAELDVVVTAPAHRRSGVGTVLVQSASTAAAALGYHALFLSCREQLTGWYTRLGWVFGEAYQEWVFPDGGTLMRFLPHPQPQFAYAGVRYLTNAPEAWTAFLTAPGLSPVTIAEAAAARTISGHALRPTDVIGAAVDTLRAGLADSLLARFADAGVVVNESHPRDAEAAARRLKGRLDRVRTRGQRAG